LSKAWLLIALVTLCTLGFPDNSPRLQCQLPDKAAIFEAMLHAYSQLLYR